MGIDLIGFLPTQMHQYGVDSDSVHPGRKASITTECADLPKYPKEDLLGQILCV